MSRFVFFLYRLLSKLNKWFYMEDRGDPNVRVEYKTDSKQCTAHGRLDISKMVWCSALNLK